MFTFLTLQGHTFRPSLEHQAGILTFTLPEGRFGKAPLWGEKNFSILAGNGKKKMHLKI